MPEITYQLQYFNNEGLIRWNNVKLLKHWNDSGNTYATLDFPSLYNYFTSAHTYKYQFYDWWYTGNWNGSSYPETGSDWSGIQYGTAQRYIDGVLIFTINDDQQFWGGTSVILWTSNHRKTYFSFNIVKIGQLYTLTFDAAGTTGGTKPDSITAQYGEYVQLPTNPFTKTGHTFSKWRIYYNGSLIYYTGTLSFEYSSGEKFISSITADMIVNSIWTINQYEITLDYKGKGTNTADKYNYNDLYTFNSPTSIRPPTGYTFGGWSETDVGDAVSYTSFNVSIAKTFYAIWTVKGINITFDRNGVGIGTTISKNYDTVFNVGNFPTLLAVGYIFDGWGNGGQNVKIADNFSFTVSIARTFYARWDLKSNDKNFSFTELSRVYGIKGPQTTGIIDPISISEYMPNIGKAANSQTTFILDFKGTGRLHKNV